MTDLSMIDVLVVALAAFYLWWLFARTDTPFLRFIQRPIRRHPKAYKFFACPWCAGAWWALAVTLYIAVFCMTIGVMTLAQFVVWAPVTWLGSAALVGIAGTLIPDDGAPVDEDD